MTSTARHPANASFPGAAFRHLRRLGKYRLYYGLVLPALLFALGVVLYPIVFAVELSFHDTVFLNRGDFVGLKHYERFLSDPVGQANLVHSLVFVFGSLALAMPLGLFLALLVNRELRFRSAIRLMLIIPWVVSQVVTALLWSWILNPQFGIFRYIYEWFGLMPVDVLGQTSTAMLTLILINVWRTFPFAMLLILAALQTVPDEMYEAARVDGASAPFQLFHITLPLIRPTILITTIMLSLAYFNYVDLPLILTGGGPLHATEVLTLRVYQEAFTFNRLGFGSAIAVIVFALNIVLSLLYIYVLRSERNV